MMRDFQTECALAGFVGTAGIYLYEMAETKAQKTMEMARGFQFPLRISVEPALDDDG